MVRTSDGETSTVSDLKQGIGATRGGKFIAAVDPGLMTGVAVWDCTLSLAPYTMQLDTDEFYTWVKDTLVDAWFPYDIVCEAFVISQRTVRGSFQPWSLEHIGLLRWAAWLRKHHFTLQQASAAKRFVTNDRLKSADWYVPGQDHANDALRHLYLYALERRIITL